MGSACNRRLYHMVISDLVTAGCPSRVRLSEDPGEDEGVAGVAEALPYLPHIYNTSCAWGLRIILHDLYGWNEPLSASNWRRLNRLIRERRGDADWPRQVMRKASVRRTVTELWRGRDGAADDVLQYSLEWAFFTRTQ